METKLQSQEIEEKKITKKKEPPKTFKLSQSILLLFLSFAITSGAAYALGHYFFWNDIDMQRVNEQLEYYKERVKVDPSNLENRIVLGYTYFLKGNNSEANKQFSYVMQEDPNYYDAYYNLGLVYLDEERYNDALAMFDKTIKIAPRDFKGYVQLGITYRNLKMYNEAMDTLEKANKLSPTNSDILYQIGLVAEAKEEFELAVDIYKDALSYDPLFEEAVTALERLKEYDKKTEGE